MNTLISIFAMVGYWGMRFATLLTIIGGIWLAALGEIKIVVIGVICMMLGHWLINLFLLPSIGIGVLGSKAYEYSTIFGAILIFLSILASFCVFFMWGGLAAQTGAEVFAHCGALFPCVLFGLGVAVATPVYQMDALINIVHTASITIGYLMLFIVIAIGDFSRSSFDVGISVMMILFIIASICETFISVKEFKYDKTNEVF